MGCPGPDFLPDVMECVGCGELVDVSDWDETDDWHSVECASCKDKPGKGEERRRQERERATTLPEFPAMPMKDLVETDPERCYQPREVGR